MATARRSVFTLPTVFNRPNGSPCLNEHEEKLLAAGIIDTADLEATLEEKIDAIHVLIAVPANHVDGLAALEFFEPKQSREPAQRFTIDGFEQVCVTQVPHAKFREWQGGSCRPVSLSHVVSSLVPVHVQNTLLPKFRLRKSFLGNDPRTEPAPTFRGATIRRTSSLFTPSVDSIGCPASAMLSNK